MKKEKNFHMVLSGSDYRFVDEKFLTELTNDTEMARVFSAICMLMNACGMSNLFTRDDIKELIFRLCTTFKCELKNNEIILVEGSIARETSGIASIPVSLLVRSLGVMTRPWRNKGTNANQDDVLRNRINEQLSESKILDDDAPFTEWKNKYSEASDKYFEEQSETIPVNYNFDKIMAGEHGEKIAMHIVAQGTTGKEVLQEVYNEKHIYEPLVYLAWLWAHGFVIEREKGWYDIDRRVPIDYDKYEDYGRGGLTFYGIMIDYDLYALENLLKDPEQVL